MLRLSAVLRVLPVLLATLALGMTAGCGGSDEPEEDAATPAEAVAETGDTVGDAYVDHFESVEAPLGERDQDLMEELEEAISTTLRNEIKDGKGADEIETTVDAINVNLDKAVELLQS